MVEVKLIPVYYTGIVTGWGCTFCLHTVVGEGWHLKDFLNPLPGPKSRSAVCGYCCPWPFTLLIYSFNICPVVLGIQQRIAPTYSLRVVKGD